MASSLDKDFIEAMNETYFLGLSESEISQHVSLSKKEFFDSQKQLIDLYNDEYENSEDFETWEIQREKQKM